MVQDLAVAACPPGQLTGTVPAQRPVRGDCAATLIGTTGAARGRRRDPRNAEDEAAWGELGSTTAKPRNTNPGVTCAILQNLPDAQRRAIRIPCNLYGPGPMPKPLP